MKKFILFQIIASFLYFGFIFAAPNLQYSRSISPETTNIYDVGTSTKMFNRGFFRFASTTAISATNINATNFGITNLTATFASTTALSTSYALSTLYFGASLSDCDNAASSKLLWSDTGKFSCGTDSNTGGGGGSGSVSTSTADVLNQITFFESSSATPALIGGSSNFTYASTTNRLTVGYASTTAISGTNANFTSLVGALTGNADTATKLTTARNIQGVSFDGSAAIDILNGTGLVRAAGTSLGYFATSTLYGTGTAGQVLGWVGGQLGFVATSTNADTATALASNPDDCGANTWATTIATNGNLTCAAVTYAGISAMTSANFAGLISDETGTGKVVFDTSPTLVTPTWAFASSTLGFDTTGYFLANNASSTITNLHSIYSTATFASTTAISSTGSAYFATTAGNVGIGTTTPAYKLTASNGLYVDGVAIVGNLTATSTLNAPAGFGGRSMTVSGTAMSADTELYTDVLAPFRVGSSTMSTTTGSFMQRIIANASTITSVWCWTNQGTSTIQLEERNVATPNTAGVDILGGGLQCGSGSGQTGTTTMVNTSIDATDIINLEIIDAEPTGNKPTIIHVFVIGTKDD